MGSKDLEGVLKEAEKAIELTNEGIQSFGEGGRDLGEVIADTLDIEGLPKVFLEKAGEGIGLAVGLGVNALSLVRGKSVKAGRVSTKKTPKTKTKVKETKGSVQEKKSVVEYEVGHYSDLVKKSQGDGIEIHHAPQQHPAKQVVKNYNPKDAPSIALRKEEHREIPNVKGIYKGTDRQLLAKTARDLRNKTNTPTSTIQELINFAKKTHPESYRK